VDCAGKPLDSHLLDVPTQRQCFSLEKVRRDGDKLVTQLGSVLAATALALTAYFALAAWYATSEDRRDATPIVMREPPKALTQH
jgi:hypothetical protein